MSLTHSQARLLTFIGQFQADHNGVAPSFEEMMAAMDSRSRGRIHDVLTALERRGRIRRLKNRARAIELLDAPHAGLSAIPTAELIAELARRAEA